MDAGIRWMMLGVTAVLILTAGCAKLQPNEENQGATEKNNLPICILDQSGVGNCKLN